MERNSLARLGWAEAIAPDHVGGMSAQPQYLHRRAVAGLMTNDGTVRPTGDVKCLAVRCEQDAVRPAAGLVVADHGARLRINHRDTVVEQFAGIEKMTVRRDGHVADKVVRL